MKISQTRLFEQQLVTGFALALLAAAFWGAGNLATRWSAANRPAVSFDIALLKYLLAALLLLAIGSAALSGGRAAPLPRILAGRLAAALCCRRFWVAAAAKSFNTYCWILAVTFIAAGTVATLENLYVVWTAAAATALFRKRLPLSWAYGAAAAVFGAFLITGGELGSLEGAPDLAGAALGLVSGIAFSIFLIAWSGRSSAEEQRPFRTIELAFLLLASAVLMYPLHVAVSVLWIGTPVVPFTGLGAAGGLGVVEGLVQCLSGLLGIGATYFLLTEATARVQSAGGIGAALIAIALSFAVPITLFGEWLLLDGSIGTWQWIGAACFAAGFAAMKTGTNAAPAQQSSRAPGRT